MIKMANDYISNDRSTKLKPGCTYQSLFLQCCTYSLFLFGHKNLDEESLKQRICELYTKNRKVGIFNLGQGILG
jgi:hypothetical protein